ncbi:MAG: hypothetical protein SPK09_02800 [Porphyromonas sp.]|nr:hypothetical protein [Porphyromonas sp.]
MEEQKRLPRALTPQDVFNTKIETLDFEGEMQEAFGNPAKTGVWIMWGGSGSGKTSMALLLAKELTKYGCVAYNSLEQGASLSMKQALERHELGKVKKGRFLLLQEDLETLSLRLSRRKSPHFVIIDSLQYTGLDYRAYKAFKEKHKDKLIIFVSHAEGIHPDGRTAKKVMYDAEMKILVEGYRATCKGRFVSKTGACYTIWEEGAIKYWLKDTINDE